jgi:hypothetical protein
MKDKLLCRIELIKNHLEKDSEYVSKKILNNDDIILQNQLIIMESLVEILKK